MPSYLLLQARKPGDVMAAHERDCFARALEVPTSEIGCWDLLQGAPPAERLSEQQRLLVGGSGAFSTLDDEAWLGDFFDFLTEVVIAQKRPTFASCFGFQAIVRAGGGTIVSDPSRAEVGTFDIHVTDAGASDPLLGSLASGFPAQLGHKDHADDLPAGCIHLAGSERSPFQALRVEGTQIVGTQFHPELNREDNLYRYDAYRAAYSGSSADRDDEVVRSLKATPEATALLRRWADQLSGLALAALILMTSLLSPAPAEAHRNVWLEEDSPPTSALLLPDVSAVEDAIEDAASEFGVPLPILQGIAHTESRWEHHPTRIATGGRQGLFQLTEDRRDFGAELLEVSELSVRRDLVTHARAFAALLDFHRPEVDQSWMAFTDIGLWRDAIIFALDLPDDFADRYVDRLFMLLAKGVIDRLPSGEPIGFGPSPIDGEHLGLWSETTERNSDYWLAVWNPTSCNYTNANRQVGDVDAVIIHTVQGSYAGCISWFHNCSAQVSAHYVVSTAGEITQIVDEIDIGWHVSCWNGFTIGIEHEGYAEDPATWYTDAMYNASAALTADILTDWNLPADRNHVMGHVEIDPQCNQNAHWDPGPGWDWDYYMSLVTGETVQPSAELVGFIRHTDLFEPENGISGATVTVEGLEPVTADAEGFYEFHDLQPGQYTICAEAPGYESSCREKTVELDAVNWGSILLEVDASGDDDDAAGDDDDASGDDDDSSGDDDDSSEGDDDDSTDDDDAQEWRQACSCSVDSRAGARSVPGLLLLLLGGLTRRRRNFPSRSF